MIQVTCSNCGVAILVPEAVQGRWGVCFGCGAKLLVPSSSHKLQEADLSFLPGTRISERYVIERAMGRGGMGIVYRASDTLMNEVVALKFLYPGRLRSQRGQRLFIKEAQVLRRLRHENIVSVHDVTSTPEGIMYLSMEFLDGVSLRGFLRTRRQQKRLVNVPFAVRITSQVLAALEYAHRIVVHRDMKPENVVITPGERVKVLDFGLAKTVGDEAAEQSESPKGKPKRVIGTEAYAAPEQKLHQDIDARSDLYATGLIFRELLSLRTPIEERIPLAEYRDDISPSLLEVLEKALRPEREQRWQTAREFRQALEETFETSYQRRVSVVAGAAAEGRDVSTADMVYLEGGSFLMGNSASPDEAPEFEETVEPFFMDIHPVTTGEYAQFLAATGRPEPKFSGKAEFSGADQPVVGVSWEEASAYAAWAGKQLPTEAQWEFAARGKGNRRYPWGDESPDSIKCNYGDFLNMPSIRGMHEEGATPEGLQDLAGNVYEWTADAYVYYADIIKGDGPRPGETRRVVRGGSWASRPEELRCSARKGLFPESQLNTLGFRCVLPAQAVPKP
jgi:formylglycine-generating enzyme required for sulfatase activity